MLDRWYLILEHLYIVVVFTVVTYWYTGKDFQSKPKSLEQTLTSWLLSQPSWMYLTLETIHKVTAEYAAFSLYGFTHIQLKCQAKMGKLFSVLCKVKKRAYSQMAEYQQQVGLKGNISLLLLQWCLEGVCCTFPVQASAPWFTLLQRPVTACLQVDNNGYKGQATML